MRIAVTDACIFIDLIELDLISDFFQLELELHTTVDVMNELFQEQKQVLIAYQKVVKYQFPYTCTLSTFSQVIYSLPEVLF